MREWKRNLLGAALMAMGCGSYQAMAAGKCFLPEQSGYTTAEALASTVEIVAKTPAGITTGSGFVVADSGDAGTPETRRILTAGHVVMPGTVAPTSIGVIDSDGNFLGTAEVVDRSARRETEATDGSVMPGTDLAVLKMKTFNRNAVLFRAIPGLSLAAEQDSRILSGMFLTPGGIEHGASGAPAVDVMGDVVGVAIRAGNNVQNNVAVQKRVPVGMLARDGNGGYGLRASTLDLPYRARGYINPVYDSKILKALGIAGRGVSVTTMEGRTLHVSIPSYPMEKCVVYSGNLN